MVHKRPLEQHTSERNGGSRAAKKRAMMKKKKEHHESVFAQQNTDGIEVDLTARQSDEKNKVNNQPKQALLQLPVDSDNDEQEAAAKRRIDSFQKAARTRDKKTEKRIAANEKQEQIVKSEDGFDDGKTKRSLENGNGEEMLHFLSRLTPFQILFPPDDNSRRNDDEDQPPNDDPLLIIHELPSETRARVLFNSLLAPSGITAAEFYDSYWEKKPLLVTNNKHESTIQKNALNSDTENTSSTQLHSTRLNGLLCKDDVKNLIAHHTMRYGQDLNVTKYCDTGDGIKRRITLDLLPNNNTDDDAFVVSQSKDVWSNFYEGLCTIRLLCPQKHVDAVHALLSTLEQEFGCMVGANAYLTPGQIAQGFAPHYDDIEAFVLQLEGYKHWKVYPPMKRGDTLPRQSSRDFTEEEMKNIEPVVDAVLGPGDVLFMPRGWVHQACTVGSNTGNRKQAEGHSLHLTVSAMQNWAWADLLELLMPEALDLAVAKSTSLREGLPRNFLEYMGAMNEVDDEKKVSGEETTVGEEEEEETMEKKRTKRFMKMQIAFRAAAEKRIMRIYKEALTMLDAACDQIGKRFLSDRLPPSFTPNEIAFTTENRTKHDKVWPNTLCRLVRKGIARLVVEQDETTNDGSKAVLYHCVDNSRVYHGNALSPMEFEMDDAPALEMLLTTTEPHWICVQDLIHNGDIEDKMQIVQSLYDEGILAIHHQIDDDNKPNKKYITTG